MRIYVASHSQELAKDAAKAFREAGHEICARWINDTFAPTNEYLESDRVRIAQEDADDVAACDALVLLAGPDRYPGGKFVEAGIALGLSKKMIVVGRRENMLLWHKSIQQVADLAEAIAALA